jgi:tetrahydromethanopterin S-methyltransferase subunit G
LSGRLNSRAITLRTRVAAGAARTAKYPMETPFAVYDALSAINVPPDKVRVVVQSMERDMALFATQSQFESLDQHSAGRFHLLHAEMNAFRERFEQIDRRFEQIDRRFEQVDKRFDLVDKHLTEAMQHIEQRLTVRLGSFLAVSTAVTATLVILLRGGAVG